MNLELAVIAILAALVVGGVIGHYAGKNPAVDKNAIAALRADFSTARDWFESEYDKLASKASAATAVAASVATASAPAAATLSPAPVQATPVAGWALGTSYTSPAALLADVARPDFPPVRIDGEQKAGVTGFDFYTLADGSVSQTKPA